MDGPIERKIQWGLGIAVAVLCSLGMIAFALAVSFVNTGNWVVHTHLVIETNQGARTALDDAETSVRGYLLTQDQAFLDPYNLVRGRIPGVIDRLLILTSDNPTEQHEMVQLKLQVARELEILRQAVAAGVSHPAPPAGQRKLLDDDQQVMSNIRNTLREARLRENKLLSVRDATWRQDLTNAIFAAAMLGLLNFVLLGYVYYVFKRDRRDLTERKFAEERVHQSESRLAAILDDSPSVIFVKDPEGRYTLVNRRFENSFHLQRQEVLGKTDMDLFPHATAQTLSEHDAKALDARRALEFEEVIPQKDRLHTYLSARVPLLNGDNQPYALCGVSTDITERKACEREIQRLNRALEDRVIDHAVHLMQAADELKMERERRQGAEERERDVREGLREIMHSSPVPICTYELESLAILEANDAASALHGSSREELLQMRMTDLYPLEEVLKLVKEMKNGGVSKENPRFWRHRTKGGQVSSVRIEARRVEWEGRDAALLLVVAKSEEHRRQHFSDALVDADSGV